ncbi:nucleoside triphosphate pyrophosphohydrolase family protein [Sphingobium sp. RSMS]|uniref:nucleoside triphosphate pyrophosphohydrolase family protein n=1 Tax=Sphingobium sp. RSMS TaxID=520734 RepID=UPI0010F86B57|nr:nucleoside triphosphate pyrophosphohydrolase family protein [Sphingobium sp. RSMS]UXC91098.1 nucleoside triphosphate pyrophosphohydrolase family protein [Sphingobium sp. RSMS]
MEFSAYQREAAETVQLDLSKANGRVELVLGLMAEVGSLAKAYRSLLRDDIPLETQRERLERDLGDILWYSSMVAQSVGIDLDEVANSNLKRVTDRHRKVVKQEYRPSFDHGYAAEEVFPRRMLFEIHPAKAESTFEAPHVGFRVVDASPYAFKGEPKLNANGKPIGFQLGASIGDPVNDNSAKGDGYRYHDAVHVAFMAVLGWSPVMRELLNLKRKSKPATDHVEDGARASDIEEALSAALKAFSVTRNDFRTDADIDGDTRNLISLLTADLEVADVPLWLWTQAIRQGYDAMASLIANGEGWLLADLDAQTLKFSADRPAF